MPIKRHKTGPGTLTLGEVGTPSDWSSQVTSITLTPSYESEDDVMVLSGEIVPGEETETFELTGTVYQDLDTTGIVAYTWTNAGDTVPFTFTPNTAAGATIAGQVKIRRLAVGGDVDADATSEFTLPVVGVPTFTPDPGV